MESFVCYILSSCLGSFIWESGSGDVFKNYCCAVLKRI
ncbi:hypothetical protein BVRB_2g024740 [Beta vulgaris subsp. vulgaris]|nr:hypothetical protein BVRB_2g024740 [Beta vulgaris subsp. vulgaris]